MRKPLGAEWLLEKFVAPERAAAIVGDLLELRETRGNLWFWAAYVRTLLSLTWWHPLAWLGAALVGFLLNTAWVHDFTWQFQHHLYSTDPESPIMVAVQVLGQLAVPIFFLLPYCAIRYGIRDRLTQMFCVGDALMAVALHFGRFPHVLSTFGIAAAVLLTVALCLRTWRRVAIVAMLSAFSGFLFFTAADVLAMMLVLAHAHGRPAVALSALFVAQIAGTCGLAMACSRLHGRMLPQLTPSVA